MINTPIQGAVFDLDGTLVDSLSVTFDAFNEGIVRMGGRRHTPVEIMKYFGTGEGEIFAAILGQDKAGKAYAICREYLDHHIDDVPLHSGVGDMLENLKSRGMPISIVTGRSWNTTEVILKHHRLLDRFVTVVANDHVGSPKPAPEGILLALSRMKIDPKHTIYVGDSWVDVRAARSAGSTAIAAMWDLMVSRDELAKHDPHHWADTPAHVLQIIGGAITGGQST